MVTSPRDSGTSDELRALQSRIHRLEGRLDRVAAASVTAPVLVAGAALMLVSLALPWFVPTGSSEFDSSAEIGWSIFVADPLGALVVLVYLATVGVAIAAAASESSGLSRAAHVLGAWVCAVPLAALVLYGLANTEVNRPAVGIFTGLIGPTAIGIAAAVRRRQLSG